jgi:hypothetical protein
MMDDFQIILDFVKEVWNDDLHNNVSNTSL